MRFRVHIYIYIYIRIYIYIYMGSSLIRVPFRVLFIRVP